MENINKIQIVPDEVYEIGADKAPVIPEWSVKDDATLYEKVNKLAHSTFDRSKFTVVGSPNITEDGIASGFSGSNQVYKQLNISTDKPITFKGKGIVGETTGVRRIFDTNATRTTSNTVLQSLVFDIGTKKVYFDCYKNNVFTRILNQSLDFNTGSIVEYEVTIGLTTQSYKITVDGVTSNFTTNVTLTTQEITNYYASSPTQYYWQGSIDLKQFSITVDGVEVFNGNKTGIDTVKPDNYTVVGNPTISEEGIASGFSSSNYITTTVDISNKPFILETPVFEYSATSSEAQYVFLLGTYNNGLFLTSTINGSGYITVNIRNSSDSILYNASQQAILNNKYQLKIVLNNTAVEAYIKINNGSYALLGSATNTSLYSLNSTTLYIGTENNNSTKVFKGSIDLNSFKVYINGDLVYQPCLKIPYTEGQNYVKIVDKLYRDRVKDLFEQKGYNGYYTIGEDDFTLPSNKWSDVIEHKENGLTVAEQRVDQTLTIRGACEQGVDVNLPMEFFDGDSYAVFGVGTTGTNTASKFTPAADGNYIAIGKGKV